jgi:hypothetical protein
MWSRPELVCSHVEPTGLPWSHVEPAEACLLSCVADWSLSVATWNRLELG